MKTFQIRRPPDILLPLADRLAAAESRFRLSALVMLSVLGLGIGACSESPVDPALEEGDPNYTVVAANFITDLWVASGSTYAIGDDLAYGRRVYVDRTYHYRDVPSLVEGLPHIRTHNADQTTSTVGEPFLAFTIDRPAVVYVAYNGSTVPGWLGRQGFTHTGQTLTVARGTVSVYNLYAKSLPAGRVRLGSNRENGGSADMYTVIVKPQESDPVETTISSEATGFAAVVNGIRPRGFGQGTYNRRSPATGAKEYHVSTTGSDSNPGTSSAPFRTINRAAQVAVAGDVVTIGAGTYRGSVSVRNAGTASRPIVFQAASRGSVVLTGGAHHFVPGNWTGGMKQSGAVHVTVRGLTFRDYAPTEGVDARNKAAVGAIRGWRIEDCLFDRAGYSGLDIRGDSVVVTNSTFQYHHTLAIGASGTGTTQLRGIRIADLVLRGNHTTSDPLSGTVSVKVVKFLYTDATVVDNIESYENNGPGWWFDTANTNWQVRNSYLHDNVGSSGRGLYLEKNFAPGLAENNVISHNEVGGVVIRNSQGVTVRGNLLEGNGKSIWVVAANGGSEYPLKDVTITRNHFKSWEQPAAIHSAGTEITSASEMNIRADYNVYDPGPAGELSYWNDTRMIRSISDMRTKLGWELNGRIGSVSSP